MPDRAPQHIITTLNEGLAALRAAGGEHFNTVQFRYLESMTEKAGQKTGLVANIVADKALAALAAYQRALDGERQRVARLIDTVTTRHPETAPEFAALFDSNRLAAVQRLADRLARRSERTPLTALLGRLEPGAQEGEGPASARLQDQENAVLELLAADTNEGPAPPAGELKAARYFRELRQQRAAQERVSLALKEAPEESGPLNPQKLVIRSMLAMREISPGYLARFVAYVDTLFWLENTGATEK